MSAAAGLAAPLGWTAALAALLHGLARGSITAEAAEAAKSRLFHGFGVSLSSSKLPGALAAWCALGSGSGECLVFGRKRRLAAEHAAFVNAVAGHGSLLEDCGPGGLREGSHPGTYIIPTALAVAETIGASGSLFLAGLVAGYEAVSRIGAAAPAGIVERRFRPLGIMGPLGAAVAAAVILGADEGQLAAALAIATNLAAGPTQGIFEGSMEPYFQAGFGARNGIFAARLGMARPQVSVGALEGDFGFFQTYGGAAGDPVSLLGPRPRPGICVAGTKRFAACLQNQQTMALIADGFPATLAPESIRRVVIRRPSAGTNGLNSPGVSRGGPFDNMLGAQMSARFTAAAALLRLPVEDPRFFQTRFSDPVIRDLTERIELRTGTDDLPTVLVEFDDGTSVLLDADRSDVLFPSAAAVRERFFQRAEHALGENTRLAAAMIDRLEDLQTIHTLTRAISVQTDTL